MVVVVVWVVVASVLVVVFQDVIHYNFKYMGWPFCWKMEQKVVQMYLLDSSKQVKLDNFSDT